jgi:1-acyl-sn-glycerol-3-phosphate acyltransferase
VEKSEEVSSLPLPSSLDLSRESLGFLYGFIRGVTRPLLRTLFDFQVSGLEYLPADGPFIVASNHHNYLDGVVLGAALPRQIAFLVMPSVYASTWIHPYFHRQVGSISINLERPDPGAIKRALRKLEDGGVIGIFPEGPFSLEGRLVNGQPGVALIALRSGVPVVPAAILGTYEALANGISYIPRPCPLTVRFGPPLSFGRYRRERKVPRPVRDEVTHRIMAEIALLLGEAPRNGSSRR